MPAFNETYGADECLQLLTASRASQTIVTAAAAVAITLKTPSKIVNNTAAAGFVAYLMPGAAAYTIEWFAAGQERSRLATMIGGVAQGTTVATILVFES